MSKVLYVCLALLCLHPWVSAGTALIVGIAVALSWGNPFLSHTKKISTKLLQASIIGLGAGMNLNVVAKAGGEGFVYTIIGILLTLGAGLILGRWLKTDSETSLLISVGTAICGGSAIAAIAPVIRAKNHSVSMALVSVFFLNAAALFLFPQLGYFFDLDAEQFGLWSALAIHDTSSVVGAASQYAEESLAIATPVKLARALWIIPLSFGVGYFWRNPKEQFALKEKPKPPVFILGFILAAALVTWIPDLETPGRYLAFIARRTLVVTLFFIGSGLNKSTLKSLGFRPFIQGFLLWILVSVSSLLAILAHWIA